MRLALASVVVFPFVLACGSHLDLGWNDAGKPDAGDCHLGTYAGSFTCQSTSTSPIPFSANGTLTVTLGFSDAGTPPESRPITLAPGSSIEGAGPGGLFVGPLTGTLDCSTRRLEGTLSDVTFVSPSFNAVINGTGPVSATYDPDASTPALVDGVFVAPVVQGDASTSTCAWSATLR